MTVMLEILSDPICPWCAIGRARLERAFEARPDHPFTLLWRPFQLNPEMPPEGMDRRAYLEGKFGGPQGVAKVYGAIADTAEQEGLGFHFDRITRTPNTLDAHRLMHWAHEERAQDDVADLLFDAYFRRGADISTHETLLEIASDAGLAQGLIAEKLASDEDKPAIREQDEAARRSGVQAAPTFIVANRYVVSGAQPADLWINVIDDVSGALDPST